MSEAASQAWAVLAAAAAAAWIYLLAARGGFWRARPRLTPGAAGGTPAPAPDVVAVVPARDEAAAIGPALASLLGQDYAGALSVVVVDDQSRDGTAERAREAAAARGAGDRLHLVRGAPLPPGWTGKMWAVAQGVAAARRRHPEAAFLWLTDADIEHDARELAALAARAERGGLDLVSVMVRLHHEGLWARLLIPAFVFFFQKLYPFAWVNDPRRRTAAAAGGSMLVRAGALARAGGIEAIRGAIIDDCALARRIKAHGAIWLGLAETTHSLRPYRGLGEVWGMVARSAYTQLDHSPAWLGLTVAGMALVYLGPPAALAAGLAGAGWTAGALGLAGWAMMAAAYRPTLRLYRQPAPAALLLPAAALLYCAMTLDSARRHWRGKGGAWKGRTYDAAAAAPGRPPESPAPSPNRRARGP